MASISFFNQYRQRNCKFNHGHLPKALPLSVRACFAMGKRSRNVAPKWINRIVELMTWLPAVSYL